MSRMTALPVQENVSAADIANSEMLQFNNQVSELYTCSAVFVGLFAGFFPANRVTLLWLNNIWLVVCSPTLRMK